MWDPTRFLLPWLLLFVTKETIGSNDNTTDLPVSLYDANANGSVALWDDEDYAKDELLFHWKCGWNIGVSRSGRNMYKARNDFHTHSAALTTRPLYPEEVFEVRVDSENFLEYPTIGVIATSPLDISYPEYMSDLSSGTWGWDVWSDKVFRDGKRIRQPYMRLAIRRVVKSGDSFGVSLTDGGALHFYRNGEDLGAAGYGLSKGKYYAYVELYWGGSSATVAD